MVTFRKATEADVLQVVELEREAFSVPWSEQNVRETIGQTCAFISVAEIDGKVASYCIVYCVMEFAEIARIATAKKYRRKGMARRLMDYTVEWCKEKECSIMQLDVRESNEGARCFYQTYGFVEDGIRKNYYEQPKEHAVLMSMEL